MLPLLTQASQAGGKKYADFASVKADFLSGALAENALKEGLIDALNLLLEPVRQHFTNNAVAKDLLAKVQQYKKEKAPLNKEFRRLDVSSLVPTGSHVVFCPAPNNNPSLQSVVDVLTQLSSAASSATPVLFLADWSAKVLSCCDGDQKAIDAYYTVMENSLKTLAPDVMEKVKVVKQSDAILTDPSNYWISVINVGRHFNLNVVQEGHKDSDPVGYVIARMMRVADVVGLNASAVAYKEGDANGTIEAGILDKYFADIPLDAPAMTPVAVPNVCLAETAGTAQATENSEYYLLDDPKVHGKLKMKKAFCEPGNASFCPPISLASCFALQYGSAALSVKRTPENGGDRDYTSSSSISADFASSSLHPGDLKAAVTAVMVGVLGRLAEGTKKEAAWKKAGACLKAAKKKSDKSAKKK